MGTLAQVRKALRPGGVLFTLDGCYAAGQPRLAKWLLDNDRGVHVREAEGAYVAQLGSKMPGSSSIEELREAFLAALTARASGDEPPNANKVRKRWEPRYAVRRSAWHALDHAWEIQDRSS